MKIKIFVPTVNQCWTIKFDQPLLLRWLPQKKHTSTDESQCRHKSTVERLRYSHRKNSNSTVKYLYNNISKKDCGLSVGSNGELFAYKWLKCICKWCKCILQFNVRFNSSTLDTTFHCRESNTILSHSRYTYASHYTTNNRQRLKY